jgi:hypothetical protein
MAGAILMLPAFSHVMFAQDAAGQPAAQPAQQGQESAPQKTTYTGDMVIAAYAINSDKIVEYDQVIATLKDSLMKSTRPEARQQLAGWRIMKNAAAQPDGSALYVHVISPVVPDADYSITNLVYEVVTDPMERLEFYNTYRAALKQPLFVIQGPITSDLSR